MKRFFFVLVFAVLSCRLTAQELHSLEGKWMASFQAPNGATREAELTIVDKAGVWRYVARGNQAKANKCIGREFPVTVQAQGQTESFQVNASSVMEGCGNLSVTITSAVGARLEGTIEGVGQVTLTRQ